MALIQFGAIVTNIRGKVGGSVFSNNIAGATVRNKSLPKRRTTDQKSLVNNLWQYLTQVWLVLTSGLRQPWEDYALNFTFHNKLGAPVAAKANIVFSTTNRFYYYINNNIILAPFTFEPPPVASLQAVSFNVTLPEAKMFFTPVPIDVYVFVYATRPYGLGKRSFMEKRVRYIKHQLLLAGDSEVDFYDEYVAIFGVPPVGQSVLTARRTVNPNCYSWGVLQYFEIQVTD